MTSLIGPSGCCPALSGGGGDSELELAYELDFRALPPQTISADGAYSLDGLAYDALGVSQTNDFEIDASGLTIEATQGTVSRYTGPAGDNGPRLLLSTDLIPDWGDSFGRSLVIDLDWASYDGGANASYSAMVGLGGDTGDGWSAFSLGFGWRSAAGGAAPTVGWQYETALQSLGPQPPLDVRSGAYSRLIVPHDGVAYGLAALRDSPDWPTRWSYNGGRLAWTNSSTTTNQFDLARRPLGVGFGKFGLWVCTNTSSTTGAAPRATLRRFRILYGPPSILAS